MLRPGGVAGLLRRALAATATAFLGAQARRATAVAPLWRALMRASAAAHERHHRGARGGRARAGRRRARLHPAACSRGSARPPGFADVRVTRRGAGGQPVRLGQPHAGGHAPSRPRCRGCGASTPTAATWPCRRWTAPLLEPRLPPALFYNLLVSARAPRGTAPRRAAAASTTSAASTTPQPQRPAPAPGGRGESCAPRGCHPGQHRIEERRRAPRHVAPTGRPAPAPPPQPALRADLVQRARRPRAPRAAPQPAERAPARPRAGPDAPRRRAARWPRDQQRGPERAPQRHLEAQAAAPARTRTRRRRAPRPGPARWARVELSGCESAHAIASHAATAPSSAHSVPASSSPKATAAATATARGSKRARGAADRSLRLLGVRARLPGRPPAQAAAVHGHLHGRWRTGPRRAARRA